MKSFSISILFVLALFQLASAQPSMLSHEAGRAYSFVGRLNVAGTRFCTATLIAEHLVVTAAHCLYHPRTKRRVPDTMVHFVAGLNRGAHAAARRVVASHVLPEYRFSGRADGQNIARDVALLELARPIDADEVKPVSTGSFSSLDGPLSIVSYSKGRPYAPSLERKHGPIRRYGSLYVLNFAVNFGASGSPVLSEGPNGATLVGIVSASASQGGNRMALTVPVTDALRRLKKQAVMQTAAL